MQDASQTIDELDYDDHRVWNEKTLMSTRLPCEVSFDTSGSCLPKLWALFGASNLKEFFAKGRPLNTSPPDCNAQDFKLPNCCNNYLGQRMPLE